MKAIISNGITYKVTQLRGSFIYTVDSKGKVKCFNVNEVQMVEVDGFPKERSYKSNRTAEQKHAEKMSVTASRPNLTNEENIALDAYMSAKKWGSVSW